ncbi:MAG: TetR family transcriptional regulator [Pseudomonadota bacterium]
MSSDELSTRSKILEAAWRLLEDPDGARTRMSDIARAAGVSRQAVYLHFDNRADLLTETTRYADERLGVPEALQPFRAATNAEAKLTEAAAFFAAHYLRVTGIADALLAMSEDEEAQAAWRDRMGAVSEASAEVVAMIVAEDRLAPGWTETEATDFLWSLLAFETWRRLTKECFWTPEQFVARTSSAAKAALVAP